MTALMKWLPGQRPHETAVRDRDSPVAKRGEDEAEPEGRERHLVGQRARLEVGGRENHAGRREKGRRGRDERGPVERRPRGKSSATSTRRAGNGPRCAAAAAATALRSSQDTTGTLS